nr:nitrate- and nitrite sensing domain-containing protein [Virgisporangium aliadipatigenens]
MRSRTTNLRGKIVALLLSLVLLWAFAAWVTGREGLGLLWVQTHNSKIYQPSEPLLLDLQTERRLSTAYLGGPATAPRDALAAARADAERHARAFRSSVQDWQADLATGDELRARIDGLLAGLDALTATRKAVDTRTIDRSKAADAFTGVIDGIFRVYDSLAGLDDKEIAADAAALIQLNRMWELISREDAMFTGVIAAGSMTATEHHQFTQFVGTQRFLGTETAAKLTEADRARYDAAAAGPDFTRLRALEDKVVNEAKAGAKPPVSNEEWRAAVEPALATLHGVVLTGGDDIVGRSTPVALGVLLRLLLAAGLGLIAVIASIGLSISTARALVARLEQLRDAAHHLADERLPDVVNRLGQGEKLDVAAAAPPLALGDDDVIGQVTTAFNAVQETAIRTAVEQAELRRSVRDVFLSISRRTQALVHRQLTLLDRMERREDDPQDLEDLFRIDHLATRMRRNAENLLVLTGANPGRVWRRNIPVVDVVRAAVAEVEDYTRVNVLPLGPVELTGRSVGDVIHLLAELIDNALSFSPPHTVVEIKGQLVANGYVVEIEDRGLGMSPEDLAVANERITSDREYRLSDNASQLGLYVVSRLTARHGVRVQLKDSAYGGTLAIVLLPLSIVAVHDAEPDEPAPLPLPAEPTAAAAARPAPPTRTAATNAAGAPENAPPGAADLPPPAPAPLPPLPQRPSPVPSAGPRHARPPSDVDGATAGAAVSQEDADTVALGGSQTPSGLPIRVRQRRPTAGRAAPPAPGSGPAEEPPSEPAVTDGSSPEDIRRRMGSYQQGTREGRAAAARLTDPDAAE